MIDPTPDPREAEILDARAQRQLVDHLLADLARGRSATAPKEVRIMARDKQNGYGQNLELVYRPKGAVA